MRNEITYEWTLETLEDGDIVDSDFSDTLSFDKADLDCKDLGLCRVLGNENYGVVETTWAYVKDGKLPTHFTDSAGCEISKVPQRFHTELAKYL